MCEGGSVINARAFSCDKFSVITFWFLKRWLRNFAKNNRYHSAIIRNIPISLMVSISWEISAYKDPTVQRKSRLAKNFADIFYWNFWYLISVVLCKVSQPSRKKPKSYDGKFVTAKCSSINYGATLNIRKRQYQISYRICHSMQAI